MRSKKSEEHEEEDEEQKKLRTRLDYTEGKM